MIVERRASMVFLVPYFFWPKLPSFLGSITPLEDFKFWQTECELCAMCTIYSKGEWLTQWMDIREQDIAGQENSSNGN